MSLLDTTNQNINQAQAQQQAGSQQQSTALNFNAGQQQMQGALANMGANIAAGRFDQAFGMPQSVTDFAMKNFERFQAPRLAARGGGGSNMIGAARNDLIANLAAQSYQQMVPGTLNAFSTLANYATRPMGENTNQASSLRNNSNGTTNMNGRQIDFGGIADTVGYGLGAWRGPFS